MGKKGREGRGERRERKRKGERERNFFRSKLKAHLLSWERQYSELFPQNGER